MTDFSASITMSRSSSVTHHLRQSLSLATALALSLVAFAVPGVAADPTLCHSIADQPLRLICYDLETGWKESAVDQARACDARIGHLASLLRENSAMPSSKAAVQAARSSAGRCVQLRQRQLEAEMSAIAEASRRAAAGLR